MRVWDAVRRSVSAEDAQDASAEAEVRLGGAVMEVGAEVDDRLVLVGAEVDDCLILLLGVQVRGRLCGRSLAVVEPDGSRRLDVCVCVCA
jgi:hypothetical protein